MEAGKEELVRLNKLLSFLPPKLYCWICIEESEREGLGTRLGDMCTVHPWPHYWKFMVGEVTLQP